MAHFAKINEKNIVEQVIVAEQDFIDSGAVGDSSMWIQTSYNTRGGIHYGTDGQPDGRKTLRKNYAGIGFTYDEKRDAFIPPPTYPSWILNEDTCLWEPPVPKPEYKENVLCRWDEENVRWVETQID